MAIQFNCPVCSAQIRVPDAVAGKRGKCPQCATLITIPNVQRPDQELSAAPEIAEPQTSSPAGVPDELAAGVPSIATDEIPTFDEPQIQTTQPLMASKLKQRQRRMSVSALAPLICGAVLIVVVFFWFREPVKSLEGQLTAVQLETEALEPAVVSRSTVGVSDEIQDFVLTDLEREPQLLKSPGSMNVEFVGSPQGLAIHVYAIPGHQFFAVDLGKDEMLRGYIAEHAKQFEQTRSNVLRTAVETFFKDWFQTRQRDPRAIVKDLLTYRNDIGLASLVGGFGFHVEAEIGSNRYRCVYEDEQRRLYFLLPTDTREFTLVGRQMAEGRESFPGRYQVQVKPPEANADAPQESADTEDAPNMSDN